MRVTLALVALIAALFVTPGASAAFLPIPSTVAGESRGTPARASVVTVLVGLHRPPLAASGLRSSSETRSPQARRQLSAIAREQVLAETELTKQLPRARVTGRHSLLLNAIAVELPAGDIDQLAQLARAARIYPSLTYRPLVDRGRAVIGADTLEALSGATGAGVKIAIVDDGIDVAHPMFAPDGFSYPAGFPRGAPRHVSPKVIVARSFPLPDARAAARRPFDRSVSFHGTHVAGTAAGNETTAAAGTTHPRVAKVRGVAPGAYLGNYRVFTTPTELGNVATTEQILAAFEAAVNDGMDVINFSGGGPEVDPESDALVRAIGIATQAGVTVVVSAGNSGDMFGAGSVSSPAVAPDAIAVGALTSSRVFEPALSVIDDGTGTQPSGIPYATPFGVELPRRLTRAPVRMRAVESITGRSGRPVPAELCSPRGNPDNRASDLPPRSLRGSVALISRGICTIASKVERARRAGAIGAILIDNRAGEPAAPGAVTSVPMLVVSDLDGQRLLDAALGSRGMLELRLGRGPAALSLEREGVVAAFSGTGPTAFGHQLKPDLSAPGVSILSASNARLAGSPFEALSGTSMAAPHVAGAAALLLEQHPDWSSFRLKSALLSTAAPAWADTARTVQAPPSAVGAGRVAVDQASAPLIFTFPQALSLGDIQVSDSKDASIDAEISVTDAGGGAGSWSVSVDLTEQPAGVTVSATPTISLAAAGAATVSFSVQAAADTPSGPVQGRLRLTLGSHARTVAFYGYVTNPQLAALNVTTLRARASGTTADSASLVEAYRFPAAPFGPPPTPSASPLREVGGERLFRFDVPAGTINAGVAIVPTRPGVMVDPFILGAPDESTVLGLAATPVTANGLLASAGQRDGAAALLLPTAGRYWVAVDSGLDSSSRTSLAGPYRIHRWRNDLEPPRVELVTRRLARARGTIAVRALDAKSGVDPLTLTLRYSDLELTASAFDYENGIALFRIPRALPRLADGSNRVLVRASDHQEAKNIVANSTGFLTNTSEIATRIVVERSRPHVSWVVPAPGRCVSAGGRVTLIVSAAGPEPVRSVRFSAGGAAVSLDRKARFGDVFETSWDVPVEARDRVRLVARALGAQAVVQQRATSVRICRPPA